jgi:hypothetical protein
MPRPASTQTKTRLNLEVSSSVRDRLERLREDTEADSLTEVIRRALAIYELLWTQNSRGSQTILRLPDGSEREVLLV